MIFNIVKNTEAPIAMKLIWTHCIEVMYYSAQQKMGKICLGLIEFFPRTPTGKKFCMFEYV